MRNISAELVEGEEPQPFLLETKFKLMSTYFEGDCSLPRMLKKMAREDTEQHVHRVRTYLLACPDDKFTNLADHIDPDDVHQVGFFDLYTEVTERRASRGKTKDKGCSIFWQNIIIIIL